MHVHGHVSELHGSHPHGCVDRRHGLDGVVGAIHVLDARIETERVLISLEQLQKSSSRLVSCSESKFRTSALSLRLSSVTPSPNSRSVGAPW